MIKQHFQLHYMHLMVEVEELVILEDYMDINILVVISTTMEDMHLEILKLVM